MRSTMALILGGGQAAGSSRSPSSAPSPPCRSVASTGSSTSRSATACTPTCAASSCSRSSTRRRSTGTSAAPTAWTCSRDGFVEILAAEQTPEQHGVVRGHGRRRAQGAAAFRAARRRLLPDPGRRSSLPDELRGAARGASSSSDADITIAALPSTAADATGMGIFTFDSLGAHHRLRGKARRRAPGADEDEPARRFGRGDRRPTDEAVHRVDGHLPVLAPGAARYARAGTGQRLRPPADSRRARRAIGCGLPLHRLLG